MNNTPKGNRLHVGIFGEVNAGKSSLFNAIIEADVSIVSELSGTTADPVQKAIELIPFGPITLIDTAGLCDQTPLGQQRMDKTQKLLERVDFALYVMDAANIYSAQKKYKDFVCQLDKKQTPHLLIITKSDLYRVKDLNLPAVVVSAYQQDTIISLKKAMVHKLSAIKKYGETLLGDLLAPGSTVLMVVPIDSEAPIGRLILPQAQLIRDCLDNGYTAYVTRETELEMALSNIKKIDLIVTDSQIFGAVSKIVPSSALITSFSILMARQKGEIETLLDGIKAISNLKTQDKILVSEVCTHNRTHEDIGRVKIPAALVKLTGLKLNFDFTLGHDYTEDPSQYSLIVHCGACMITSKEMHSRIALAKKAKTPITNYGLLLAHANGILERSIEILSNAKI